MPCDLIPDWMPILGYLDDVIILPLLVWLALRSVPGELIAECERRVGASGIGGGEPHAAIESAPHSVPRDDSGSGSGTERSD
jgi:uncharacterized membrane protein YkvA (DUF1232 family)